MSGDGKRKLPQHLRKSLLHNASASPLRRLTEKQARSRTGVNETDNDLVSWIGSVRQRARRALEMDEELESIYDKEDSEIYHSAVMDVDETVNEDSRSLDLLGDVLLKFHKEAQAERRPDSSHRETYHDRPIPVVKQEADTELRSESKKDFTKDSVKEGSDENSSSSRGEDKNGESRHESPGDRSDSIYYSEKSANSLNTPKGYYQESLRANAYPQPQDMERRLEQPIPRIPFNTEKLSPARSSNEDKGDGEDARELSPAHSNDDEIIILSSDEDEVAPQSEGESQYDSQHDEDLGDSLDEGYESDGQEDLDDGYGDELESELVDENYDEYEDMKNDLRHGAVPNMAVSSFAPPSSHGRLEQNADLFEEEELMDDAQLESSDLESIERDARNGTENLVAQSERYPIPYQYSEGELDQQYNDEMDAFGDEDEFEGKESSGAVSEATQRQLHALANEAINSEHLEQPMEIDPSFFEEVEISASDEEMSEQHSLGAFVPATAILKNEISLDRNIHDLDSRPPELENFNRTTPEAEVVQAKGTSEPEAAVPHPSTALDTNSKQVNEELPSNYSNTASSNISERKFQTLFQRPSDFPASSLVATRKSSLPVANQSDAVHPFLKKSADLTHHQSMSQISVERLTGNDLGFSFGHFQSNTSSPTPQKDEEELSPDRTHATTKSPVRKFEPIKHFPHTPPIFKAPGPLPIKFVGFTEKASFTEEISVSRKHRVEDIEDVDNDQKKRQKTDSAIPHDPSNAEHDDLNSNAILGPLGAASDVVETEAIGPVSNDVQIEVSTEDQHHIEGLRSEAIDEISGENGHDIELPSPMSTSLKEAVDDEYFEADVPASDAQIPSIVEATDSYSTHQPELTENVGDNVITPRDETAMAAEVYEAVEREISNAEDSSQEVAQEIHEGAIESVTSDLKGDDEDVPNSSGKREHKRMRHKKSAYQMIQQMAKATRKIEKADDLPDVASGSQPGHAIIEAPKKKEKTTAGQLSTRSKSSKGSDDIHSLKEDEDRDSKPLEDIKTHRKNKRSKTVEKRNKSAAVDTLKSEANGETSTTSTAVVVPKISETDDTIPETPIGRRTRSHNESAQSDTTQIDEPYELIAERLGSEPPKASKPSQEARDELASTATKHAEKIEPAPTNLKTVKGGKAELKHKSATKAKKKAEQEVLEVQETAVLEDAVGMHTRSHDNKDTSRPGDVDFDLDMPIDIPSAEVPMVQEPKNDNKRSKKSAQKSKSHAQAKAETHGKSKTKSEENAAPANAKTSSSPLRRSSRKKDKEEPQQDVNEPDVSSLKRKRDVHKDKDEPKKQSGTTKRSKQAQESPKRRSTRKKN